MARLGAVAFRADEQQPFLGYELAQRPDYSEATAAHIDAEVQRLLNEAYEQVRNRLGAHREDLYRLVSALLRDETVDALALERIWGRAPITCRPTVPHPEMTRRRHAVYRRPAVPEAGANASRCTKLRPDAVRRCAPPCSQARP